MLATLPDSNDQKEPAVQYPTPLKYKHTQRLRRRSSSVGATFYSSTIVPPSFAPLDSEALSSLISSLTLISEAQKADSATESQKRIKVGNDGNDLIQKLAINPDFHSTFYQNKNPIAQDEGDCCPPPVAGYNTINAVSLPARPTTAGNDRALRKPRKRSHLVIKTTKSQANLKSGSLQSPTHNLSNSEPRPSYNGSISSLPSASSKLSVKSPFRSFFATRMGTEQNDTDHLAPLRSNNTNLEDRSSFEKRRDAHRFSAFVRVENIKTDFESTSSDAKTLASISPITRNDLNENLIPSRRSSLRSGRGRSSRNSRDLKSLNIDQDLIEENNETVQRIRELQQAREKRHNEWRKEAKRSEKAAKRLSMPSPSPSPSPVKKSPSSRSSWHSKVADTLESEEPSELSMQINGNDGSVHLASVKVAEFEFPAPGDHVSGAPGSELQRQSSITTSTTQSISSVKRHRQRLSDSIKRVSSVRPGISEDTRGVLEEVDAFLGSPRFTQKIRHPRTGRTIAFSEVGDPNGSVVLCCVGMGLTRYVTSFYDEIAKAQKLRIITPDRPGVGETELMPAERSTPLAWVDDVAVICSSLGIDKFSLLAHSAGAIYALATALKMPQYVRGRIHLLGPWIPPSQLVASGPKGDIKTANLPTSHRLLSFLPASFMKAANSRFLSTTSASVEPRSRKDRKRDKELETETFDADLLNQEASLSRADMTQHNRSFFLASESTPSNLDYFSTRPQNYSNYRAEDLQSLPHSPAPASASLTPQARTTALSPSPSGPGTRTPNSYSRALTPQARSRLYNSTLTSRTWNLSTLDANPAVDLVICLERRRPIGFRYTDITRSVVVHHGANDTRVPLENVRWLSSAMKRCELRVLEGEGHGLMASAGVMSEVLGEVGKEWEEWMTLNQQREKERKREEELDQDTARVKRGYPRW